MGRREILKYKKEQGILYLELNQNLKAINSEDVADGISVDLGFGNEIVGIEILGVNEWPDKLKQALIRYFEGTVDCEN